MAIQSSLGALISPASASSQRTLIQPWLEASTFAEALLHTARLAVKAEHPQNAMVIVVMSLHVGQRHLLHVLDSPCPICSLAKYHRITESVEHLIRPTDLGPIGVDLEMIRADLGPIRVELGPIRVVWSWT